MKTNLLLTLPLLWAGAVACGNAPAAETTAATPAVTAATPAVTVATTPPAAMSPDTPPPAAPAPRYDVRGIFDPGFNGIIAYAIKVPHGWLMQQSFTRDWDGANPNNEISLSLTAPDQHASITMLPEMRYRYPTGPNGQIMLQMAQQRGQAANMIAPLLPVQYLKQVLLPRLQQAGSPALRIISEHEGQAQPNGPQMQQANGYVEGVLPNGRKVRVTARVVVRPVDFGQGNGLYIWSVVPHIEESNGDLAPVVAQAKLCMDSLTPNPTWWQQDKALKERGNAITSQQVAAQLQQFRAAQEQTMSRFRQNVANQQARSNAINQNYQSKQQANSQVASAYADYMGDKTLYQNPETGERVKVQGSLGNVYQDASGTVLNSDAPLSGNHVNWQQLQQVELKNY